MEADAQRDLVSLDTIGMSDEDVSGNTVASRQCNPEVKKHIFSLTLRMCVGLGLCQRLASWSLGAGEGAAAPFLGCKCGECEQ